MTLFVRSKNCMKEHQAIYKKKICTKKKKQAQGLLDALLPIGALLHGVIVEPKTHEFPRMENST
jgi:hypothetical protein